MTRTIAIAGGTGALGRRVVERALTAGWTVRLLTRDEARVPAALRGRVTPVLGDGRDRAAAARLVEGADAVFSCAGASVAMERGHGWRGYGAVDPSVNGALIDAARAGKPRFVYVSVFHAPAMRGLAYIDAHERVADALDRAGLPHAVVRPTGFFSAIARAGSAALRLVHPRMGQFARFIATIATTDLIAPARGTLRLCDAFSAAVIATAPVRRARGR